MHLEENQWFPQQEISLGKIFDHSTFSHLKSIKILSILSLKKHGTDVSKSEDDEELPEASNATISRVF